MIPTGRIEGAYGNVNDIATLDEPVSETILRDLRAIATKIKHVLLPSGLMSNNEETMRTLKNWDLYGPLLLCMVLSIILSLSTDQEQASYVFAAVFVVIWCGSAVVTLNAQLLGGKISFFQSTCVLGYCVFPLVISAILCRFMPKNAIWKFIVVGIGFAWATRASIVFMSQLVNDDRKVLACYPVFLFYIVIGWMIFASE